MAALGTPIGTLPMRYLGLPLTKGRMLRTDWIPVIEKVERRLDRWQAKLLVGEGGGDWCWLGQYWQAKLLLGGGLVLVRSVLAAILIFYLSVYKLPIRVGKR